MKAECKSSVVHIRAKHVEIESKNIFNFSTFDLHIAPQHFMVRSCRPTGRQVTKIEVMHFYHRNLYDHRTHSCKIKRKSPESLAQSAYIFWQSGSPKSFFNLIFQKYENYGY